MEKVTEESARRTTKKKIEIRTKEVESADEDTETETETQKKVNYNHSRVPFNDNSKKTTVNQVEAPAAPAETVSGRKRKADTSTPTERGSTRGRPKKMQRKEPAPKEITV